MSEHESERATPGDAADYSVSYYASHLGEEDYGWDSDVWRGFFRTVAARVGSITSAHTVLDVGCARGLFVQALREVGVDAAGFDVSSHAVSSAHPDIRDHLWVQSATTPIEGRFDLVSCIEVLEHMSPQDADLAIEHVCAVSDQILFSSSPGDFAEPTHVNVRPTSDWVAAFAERGFFRRTDVSLDFLTGWAVLFSRRQLTPRDVVHLYEDQYASLHVEVIEKKAALLEAHRELGRLHGKVNDPDADVKLERARLAQAEPLTRAEGELARVRFELERRGDRVDDLERLAASLQERAEAAERRIDDLSSELASSKKRARVRLKRLRVRLKRRRKQHRRAVRALGRQRARTTSVRRQLAEVTGSRRYRVATVLSSPRRLAVATARSMRPATRGERSE